MMDDTTLKMAVAGFLHDIGKFADKDALGVDEAYVDAHAATYLPVWNGRYSHHHAVYTARFIEKFNYALPMEFNAPVWGEGDSLISLAAGHHNPASASQWVIAEADRITSAWDRDKFAAEDEKAVKNMDEKKLLLISGNFYGIQPFIFKGYGESRRFRSKLLRGRSFYVSLLSELTIDLLCRKLGIPIVCAIFHAAGRFTVVAQNTHTARIEMDETSKTVNDWLLKKTFGETSVGFSSTNASLSDFREGRFSALWDKVSEGLDKKKFQKIDLDVYGGAVEGYLTHFQHGICRLCGKRPAQAAQGRLRGRSGEKLEVCGLCEDQVRFGSDLYKYSVVSVLDRERASGLLLEPVFGKYQIDFSEKLNEFELKNDGLLHLFDISHDLERQLTPGCGKRFLQGYVPRYAEGDQELSIDGHDLIEDLEEIRLGEVKTLESIARAALIAVDAKKTEGVPFLGVLKADVDQLGLLIGCGLPESRQSVSRIANLSRQLNLFFSHYLPVLLTKNKQFKDVYTVFAGGDDLFLLGPWNVVYALALELREEFSRYVCHNPEIHFSAGFTLHKSHVPVDILAAAAEEALDSSKSAGRDRFTMFCQTTTWSEIAALEKVRLTFEGWIQNQVFSRAMLYRINELAHMAAQEEMILGCESINRNEMNCMRWRSLLVYTIARNVRETGGDATVKEIIATLAEWLDKFRGNLRIPLWYVLYAHR
jgi:CRISPR-associated protein Csm1